ncbi:MAG: hypothetical protein H6523_12820 [Mycolicibacterium sp.]|nr:hypothetical protein [Mycolicibacterium sp.]
MITGEMKSLSQRYATLVDAYEEFLIVKRVRDAIDECALYVGRKGGDFYAGPYFVLPDYPEVRTVVWYIEASPTTQNAAVSEVDAAVKRYSDAFQGVTHGAAELHRFLVQLGLPAPSVVEHDAQQRRHREPWLKQFWSEPILKAQTIVRKRPQNGDFLHDRVHCITDPHDAVELYRQDWASMAGRQSD